MTLTPSQVAQAQLDAYNAKDIDAFMAFWHDDAQIFAFPDTLLASGAEAIRARHVERFTEPNLHGKLVNRMAQGTMVVDEELVTRTFADGPGELDVICIYEITDGRIAKSWFKVGPQRLHSKP